MLKICKNYETIRYMINKIDILYEKFIILFYLYYIYNKM